MIQIVVKGIYSKVCISIYIQILKKLNKLVVNICLDLYLNQEK